MKKSLLALIGLSLFSIGLVQAKPTTSRSTEKFYGKIVNVDAKNKTVTVFNKKRKLEEGFKWDKETNFRHKKQAYDPANLAIDQYLIISFVQENNINLAKRITVRVPYKRKKK